MNKKDKCGYMTPCLYINTSDNCILCGHARVAMRETQGEHECPGVGCRICAELEYQQLEKDHARAIGERQDDPEIQREGKWK